MSYAQHAWKQPECPDTAQDRVDGVNGHGSPLIDWVQRSFHPYLVVVLDDWELNPSFTPDWPRIARNGTSGQLLHSRVVLLNDGVLSTPGDEFTLWSSLRWDSANGSMPSGSAPTSVALTIQRGFSASHNVSVVLPHLTETVSSKSGVADNRTVFLILKLIKDDVVLFTEDRIKIQVTRNTETNTVKTGDFSD